jgi:hypothetical protein
VAAGVLIAELVREGRRTDAPGRTPAERRAPRRR